MRQPSRQDPSTETTRDAPAGTAGEAPSAPPAHDEFPPGTLVAVARSDPEASAVVVAARDAGSAAYALAPSAVLGQDARRRDGQSRLSAVYEGLASLVSDQRGLQDRYLDHARAGHTMIVASATDEATAERLWEAMRAQGAHEGTWYGTTVVREML